MFKLILLVCAFGLVVANPNWESFKSTHGKKYENPLEDIMRKMIFEKNKEKVEKFNLNEAEKAGYRMGLNHLSDRTREELELMNGFRMPVGNLKNSAKGEKFLQEILDRSDDIPESLDWRTVPGRVSRVKYQGDCGSCWAFSSTGALEGQMAVQNTTKGLIPLSEQDLIDCSRNNAGCNGGYMFNAWKDIQSSGGIEDEKTYPYEEEQGECKFDREKAVFTDNGGAVLPHDEEAIKKVVANFGPVSIGINASPDSFMVYSSGVYYDDDCAKHNLNHAVLIVGYGKDEKNVDYWIVKNSWGEDWGDKGYIRMARNRNTCGISKSAMIPTF